MPFYISNSDFGAVMAEAAGGDSPMHDAGPPSPEPGDHAAGPAPHPLHAASAPYNPDAGHDADEEDALDSDGGYTRRHSIDTDMGDSQVSPTYRSFSFAQHPQLPQADAYQVPLLPPGHSLPEDAAHFDQVFPWYRIHEDTSTAAEDELRRIQSAGEVSALDHAYWQKTAFKKLHDEDYSTAGSGHIQFVIHPFNGTRKRPARDLIIRSHPLVLAGHTWRVKIYPKGNSANYVAAYVECQPCTHTADPPQPLKAVLPPRGGRFQTRPEQVSAQIVLIMFNPQDPRVHFAQHSTHCFTTDAPDRGFSRFGPAPWYELGRRLPDTRQAMLRNDALGFVAHIRVHTDRTDYLFAPHNWTLRQGFERTGAWPVRNLADGGGEAANLTAAVVSFVLLPQVREILYKAGCAVTRDTPLVAALQALLWKMRLPSPPGSRTDPPMPGLERVAEALNWHGRKKPGVGCGAASCSSAIEATKDSLLRPWHPWAWPMRDFDVVQIWEVLIAKLGEEWAGTVAAEELRRHFVLDGFRIKMPASFAKVEDAITALNWDPDAQDLPRVLLVELPRRRYDERDRVWKKLDHAIELSDAVEMSEELSGCYMLYGVVLHSDETHSRDFTPILRPDGQQWVKFSTSKPQRVTRLTFKQALDDSETTAYLAIYIRTDSAARDIGAQHDACNSHTERFWDVDQESPAEGAQDDEQEGVPMDEGDSDEEGALSDGNGPGSVGPRSRGPAPAEEPRKECTCAASAEPAVDASAGVLDIDFLGGGVYRGMMHGGFKHGYGHEIHLNGDKYKGEYKRGMRHGTGEHQLANGDLYEGGWKEGKMDGQGVYTTKATGNTYVGGFKDDKPHGSFRLTGEHAETLKSCLICFEGERDAVFYPCGHQCSCMACARQLVQCPYCQRRIDDSVRLFTI